MNKRWPHKQSKHADKRRERQRIVTFYKDDTQPIKKGGYIMDKVLTGLKGFFSIQDFIACVLISTTCYLWATGQEVPSNLWTADTIVLGFSFGAKIQQAVTTVANNRKG